MIPVISVDETMGSIKAAGENVEVRINGRKATVEQVKNLTPENVKKVEWIDNPGLRYNGVSYVLNFIVSNPERGGSLRLAAQPILNVVFGNYNGDLKLNHGKSQWFLNWYLKPCISDKVHREYQETFTYPDGEILKRTETPLSGKIKNTQGSFSFSYSYIKQDSTIFYAGLTDWSNLDNLSRFNGLLTLNDQSRKINLLNENKDKGHTPSLSLYLEQHLKRNQTLVMDFSASIYSGFSSTAYRESYPAQDLFITDINTYIKDLNQAYGIEADYIKNFNNSKITAGISYSANRNRSKYRYLDNSVFHQRQDKVYFFGEYFQKINKITFTAGLGAQYTNFKFIETGMGSDSWNLRPQASFTYTPLSEQQFRLSFSSWQTSPSLNESNPVPQQTDGFQWNVGNQSLKTYNTYRLSFRYGFSFWRISGNFGIQAKTSPKAIAPYLFWEGDKLITSYENSHGKQSLSFSLSPQINIIPEWLMASGSLDYTMEKTEGQGYHLSNRCWSGNANIIITHWNFTAAMQYGRAQRTLWGEKLSWGEDFSSVALVYNIQDWQIGAFMFMPFGQYDQGSKMMSKWNHNEFHLRLDFRMVGLMISYNLQWGKQKRGVDKLIDADVNVEKSSAKSR